MFRHPVLYYSPAALANIVGFYCDIGISNWLGIVFGYRMIDVVDQCPIA